MTLSRPELRALVFEALKSDADFDDFCASYFPEARGRFGDGMDRVRKTIILLDYADHEELTARLNELKRPRRPSPTSSPERLRILVLASNPGSTSKLDLAREIQQIEDRIGAGKHRDSIELIVCWAARPGDLQRELLKAEPQVLHFSGHGTSERLTLEAREGRASARIDNDALVDLVGILKDNLRLVVLNACSSETLAAALVQHVDYAIGMSKPVGDDAAIEFSASFYQAIAFGRSIESAFKLGCNAMKLKGIPEDQTPQLKARAEGDPGKLVLVGPR